VPAPRFLTWAERSWQRRKRREPPANLGKCPREFVIEAKLPRPLVCADLARNYEADQGKDG
jgi:hypothetical protein